MGLVTPGRPGASRRTRQGALHGHRRRGHVRDRQDHAVPRGNGIGQRLHGLGAARRAGSGRGAGSVGHAADNLGDADTLVVSTAIRPDNPELAEARRRGLPVLHRATALASMMLGHQSIAVAGTHGKTTTTSMITTVLLHSGADPSYVIGGILAETGVGAALGHGPAFVVEADESDGSFLMFSPDAAVVTSGRGRPPGQLRHARSDRDGVRSVRRPDYRRRPADCLRR